MSRRIGLAVLAIAMLSLLVAAPGASGFKVISELGAGPGRPGTPRG